MYVCTYFLTISLIAKLLKDASINSARALFILVYVYVCVCVCVLCPTNVSVLSPNHSHEKSAQTAKSHVPLLYNSMVTDLFDLLIALSSALAPLPA